MIKFKERIGQEFDNDPVGTLMGLSLTGILLTLVIFLVVILPIAFIADAVNDDPAPQQTQGEWK